MISRLRGVFYGWWVVAGGMVSIALSSGMFMHGFQFYFEPMRRQFGWSRTLISGAYTLSRVESGFLGPLGGWLVQRFGSRIVMAGGFVILAVGLVMLGLTRNVPMFYASFLILSVGSGLAAWTPVVPALTNWFRRRRAMAVGLTMMGMGFGGILVAPLVAFFINNFSWDKTALGCGIVALIIGIPLARVMRYSPEPYGMLPDGDKPEKKGAGDSEKPEAARQAEQEFDYTLKEALRTPAFWLMSMGHSVSLLTISSLSLHLVPYLETDLGFTTERAATVVVAVNAFLMSAQPVGGFLGDRLPKRHIAAGTMLGHATALLLFATADGFWQVFLAAGIQGMSWGIRGPVITAMRGEYFGRKNFPMIQGYSHLVLMGGQIVGPMLLGYMGDNYSYSAGLKIIAAMTAAGMIMFLLLRNPQPPQRAADPLRR